MIRPEEAFSGVKSDVLHFNIFGSSIYCHVSKESRNKLEPTIELGLFVGYTKNSPQLPWYFPSIRMIVV